MASDEIMEGQISIFDLFQTSVKDDFETMDIKTAVEIIQNRTGLKFKLDERFGKKQMYSAKKKGLEIEIEFDHYSSNVNGGRRYLGVDYAFKTQGGARPCESMDEAVKYIRDKLNMIRGAAV